MNDTPEHILKKQFEIIQSLPLEERISLVFELTELSRTIIFNRLKEKYPFYDNSKLQAELFRVFYQTDFDPLTLNDIAGQIERYHHKKEKNQY